MIGFGLFVWPDDKRAAHDSVTTAIGYSAESSPTSFFEVAADVLGVQSEYLRGETDAMTVEEEQRRLATTRPNLNAEEEQVLARIRFERELLEAHELGETYTDEEQEMLLDLAYAWSYALRQDRLYLAAVREGRFDESPDVPPPERGDIDDALTRIRSVLELPFRLLGRVVDPTDHRADWFHEYVYTCVLALRNAPNAGRRPRTREEEIHTAETALHWLKKDLAERPEQSARTREWTRERIVQLEADLAELRKAGDIESEGG